MLRETRLNPNFFLEVLFANGIRRGSSNGRLQCVKNPKKLGLSVVIRTDQPLTPEHWMAHLDNLEIPISVFEEWHDSYRPPLDG
jgi:hypothetical protein